MKRAKTLLLVGLGYALVVLMLNGCGVLGWFFGIGGGGNAKKAGEYERALAEIAGYNETRDQATRAVYALTGNARVALNQGRPDDADAALVRAVELALALTETQAPQYSVAMDDASLGALVAAVRDDAGGLAAARRRAASLSHRAFGASGTSPVWRYLKFAVALLLLLLTVVGSALAYMRYGKQIGWVVLCVGGGVSVFYFLIAYSTYVLIAGGAAVVLGVAWFLLRHVTLAATFKDSIEGTQRGRHALVEYTEHPGLAKVHSPKSIFDAAVSCEMHDRTDRAIHAIRDAAGVAPTNPAPNPLHNPDWPKSSP